MIQIFRNTNAVQQYDYIDMINTLFQNLFYHCSLYYLLHLVTVSLNKLNIILGHIMPNSSGMFGEWYDQQPETLTPTTISPTT